ncbi:MAG: hypothetical protein R3185_05995, partial [Candidatus Thermoplasmatota archaeon]|nr:hypothetical protein [Candidatus Thermoplasmatota archaeon]
MRAALSLVALLLLSGCTSVPDPAPPSPAAYIFTSSRVDQDGDGLFDHVNITLVSAQEPLTEDRLAFELDGQPVTPVQGLANGTWAAGTGVLLACSPGHHEVRVLIDGQARKLVVHECGVARPQMPPAFQARLVDGDGDGVAAAIQLTLVQGGPIEAEDLNVTMAGEPLRIYANPVKSRVLRGQIANGTNVWTDCSPEGQVLEISYRGNPLPELPMEGCGAYDPGIDAPVRARQLDVDGNGVSDGWNLTLGIPNDGPFDVASMAIELGGSPVAPNGSVGLDPP